jgi:hypothetical protein
VSIISDDQLARAVTLQTRYDAALKVIGERWQPFKDIMTDVGMKLHETFVQDLTDLAALSTGIQTLYDGSVRLLSLGWDKLRNGLTGIGIPAQQYGPLDDNAPSPLDKATASLRSGLSQPTQVSNARNEVNLIQDKVWKDQSKSDKDQPDSSAYDRATESIQK